MANKIYQATETALWFVPATATQAENAAFEVHNLASGAGRQSAQYDFGTSSRASVFNWRAFIQFATAPVVGQRVGFFLKTSDGNHPDNDDGTTEGAVSAEDKLRNLIHIGDISVDQAAANIEMVKSGTVSINARYVQVVAWNYSDDGLTNDVDENGFILIPVPPEVQ